MRNHGAESVPRTITVALRNEDSRRALGDGDEPVAGRAPHCLSHSASFIRALDVIALAAVRAAEGRVGGSRRSACRSGQRDVLPRACLMEESFGEQDVERGGARLVADSPETASLFARELEPWHRDIFLANPFYESCRREHEGLPGKQRRPARAELYRGQNSGCTKIAAMDATKYLRDLEASGFRDIAGMRGSFRVPVSRSLVNRVVADALGGTAAPIRSIDIHPRDGDRFDVLVTVTWPFVPPLNVAVAVLHQPRFPESPVLVFRWSLLGAVGAIASRFIASLNRLPAGVRLDGDLLLIDVVAVARGRGAAPAMLGYVTALELHTVEGGVVLEGSIAIPEP
jgi:hypothetical protein